MPTAVLDASPLGVKDGVLARFLRSPVSGCQHDSCGRPQPGTLHRPPHV